jgi:peptidyl-prolyl cis-trans isomerase A (cyclophilin A)
MKRNKPLGRIEQLEVRRVMHVEVLSPLADVTAAPDAVPALISLANRFDDHHVAGTVVRFDVNTPAPLDKVYVELFDQPGEGRTRTTPATVANFLSYVDGGHYGNTFIHRSVPGFVVQGGGFNVTGSPISINNVTQFPSVVNEPGNTNVRGTIAMAKLGSDPNSATNQWFFSLADNSANLDNQNGGFTAFGRVLGNGMAAVDAMAAVPRFGYASPFDTVPLRNVPGADPSTNPQFTNAPVDTATLTTDQFVMFPNIVRVGELVYTVSTTVPEVVTPSIEADGSLKLVYAPGATGTGSVTVRATSVFDPTVFAEDAFQVTVAAPAPLPVNAMIGMTDSELIISRAVGGAFVTSASLPLPAGETWVNSVAGDFDGDGLTDTAMQNSAGVWWVARTTAQGTATAAVPWAALAVYQFPTVGDFDADGRDDIAVRNETNGAWRVLMSTGSAFSSSRFGRWNATLTWGNVAAGDFNADGKDDLVGQRGDGAWVVAASTGTSFLSNIWAYFAVDQFGTVGDFDADGRDDVAVRNAANGAWRVLVSDGSTFTAVKFGAWATDTTWSNVRAGDFDGDGRTDLVGQRTDGSWQVSRSTGAAFETTVWAVLSSNQFATVGDFNADGRADVAVRNAANGGWRVLTSSGSAFSHARVGDWPTTTAWSRAFAAHC